MPISRLPERQFGWAIRSLPLPKWHRLQKQNITYTRVLGSDVRQSQGNHAVIMVSLDSPHLSALTVDEERSMQIRLQSVDVPR